MSHSLAQPTATNTLRGWAVRLWQDPEARSITIGVAAVVVLHLLLWVLGPKVLRVEHARFVPREESAGKTYNIELADDSQLRAQEKPKDPFKFVETNPEAPENTPDKTNNFGAQNQQVAQEKPTPDGKNDRPATEGKKDFESNQIVSGRLTTPLEHVPAVPPQPETSPTEQQVTAAEQQRPEQNPLSGFEKKEGDNKDAVGTNIAPKLANAKAIPERVEGAPDVPLIEGVTGVRPVIDPKRPQPRPQLTKTIQARPAILAENKFGTTNIGAIGVDAKWSNYGAYLQRMIDTVQVQWERIIVQWNANPSGGSAVTVKFVLDAEGKIAQIVGVESTANETSSRACVSAITDRAPYGPWTDDMKAVLGERQEMTFTFYYQ